LFLYQLRLALLSLKATPVLTGLITLGIAIGIASSMSAFTYYYNCSANPVAYKDSRLYSVRLNSWGPAKPYRPPNEPPFQLTFMDATELMKSNIPYRKTIMYKAQLYVSPPNRDQKPYSELVRLTSRGFFNMFDVPFLHGGPWGTLQDEGPEEVVVIGRKTNDRLFSGANSLGKSLRIGERDYRVVGVIDHWNPLPKVYDLNNGGFSDSEQIFIPFLFTEQLRSWSAGNTNNWQSSPKRDFDELLTSERVWLQMWVELPDGPARFKEFIDHYTLQQKVLGRFPRVLNNRLDRPSVLLTENEVVNDDSMTSLLIGGLVLIACILNVLGLILGKFSSKAAQVGVRRALGASRVHVFCQHIMESVAIGLCGALLALPLTFLGLIALQSLYFIPASLFRMDGWMLLTLILLSIGAAVLAGLFPAWRVCNTPPAIYLKIQ